jgi:hypothetical protein
MLSRHQRETDEPTYLDVTYRSRTWRKICVPRFHHECLRLICTHNLCTIRSTVLRFARNLIRLAHRFLSDDPIRILRRSTGGGIRVQDRARNRAAMKQAAALLPGSLPERQRDELFKMSGFKPDAPLRALEIWASFIPFAKLPALKKLSQSCRMSMTSGTFFECAGASRKYPVCTGARL